MATRKGRRPAPSSDPSSREVKIGDVTERVPTDEEVEAAQQPAPRALSAPPATAPTPAAAALEQRYADITVPSRGLLYKDKMPGGRVQIRKILAAEHNSLFTSGGDMHSKLNRLLRGCARLPEGIDLLTVDRFYILIALRTESFGANYIIDFRCEHCGLTNKGAKVNINEDLDETVAGDDFAEPVYVDLPDAEVSVGLRYRRESDETAAVREKKRARAKGVEGTSEDTTFASNLKRQIIEIDEAVPEDAFAVHRLVKDLTARDLLVIQQKFDATEPGIDTTIYPECTGCGGVNEQQMQFDAEFFRPSVL